MKNIRRLIIVMTFAIMALLMMTAVSFAETKLVVDGKDVAFQETTIYDYNTYYIVLDAMPTSIQIESDDFDKLYGVNNWNECSVPVNKDSILQCGYGYDQEIYGSLGITALDDLYLLADNDFTALFAVAVKGSGETFCGLAKFQIGGEALDPTATYEMTEGTAALLLRANNNTAFSAFAAEDFTITNYAGDFSATVTAGNTYTAAARFMSADNTRFDIPEDDVRELLQLMGKGSEYYADHSYKAIIFTNSSDEKVYVLCDFGYPPGPAGTIGTIEQLTDDSVSIEITGESVDFTEYYIPQWFNASLKNADDEEIPAAMEFTVIDSTHIKCTYTIDRSYEPKLGTEKSTAELTVSYNGAAEPKVFDAVIPATSYWSKYAEEPQKIVKGDKDWPEFVGYYKISTPEELAWFAGLVNGELEGVEQNFKANAFLANDIICNDTEGWEDWNQNTAGLRMWDCTIGKGETINYTGQKAVSFRGVFDGNGFAIRGLYIIPDVTVQNYNYIGEMALFPNLYNAEIRNLGVNDSFIYNDPRWNGYGAGGIASYVNMSLIENCWFGGHVKADGGSGNSRVGGIVRQAQDSDIRGCYNAGLVEGTGADVAGIVGYGNCTIEGCYNIGNGGFGITSGNTMFSCYNAGTNMLAGNNAVIRDSFYLAGAPECANATELTEEEFKDGTLLEGLYADYFCADDEGDAAKNSGYPILIWQSDLFKVKKAAVKEVKYLLDPSDYNLTKKELEAAIATAVAAIENAESEADVNSAKSDAIDALNAFKDDATLVGENDEAMKELQKKLAEIEAKIELQGASVKVAEESVVYSGKAQTPKVIVTGASGAELKEGEHYTVAYEANTDPGVATVTVTGAGTASSETKTATFNILPKKAALKKVTPAKKKLTITWAKDSTVTGYEVQYALKKNFKGAKKANITKAGTAKKVVKKLKSGKKYFVRVRSYKTVGKTKLYGAWSQTKNAKVK